MYVMFPVLCTASSVLKYSGFGSLLLTCDKRPGNDGYANCCPNEYVGEYFYG